ncbi:MAG TPA: ATP-binding protein [Polyangia bacterium]|nr:ATP-binding protein [Polyangia bacterium]
MSSELRRIVVRALALPLVLAVALAALLATQVVYLRRLAGWVEHTQAVMFTASRTLRLVVDQETGIRGYLLTGAPEFLEPYLSGHGQVSGHLGELDDLVRDNPEQAARARGLRLAIANWEAGATAAIADARRGDASRARQGAPDTLRASKARTDDIRRRADEIVADERRLLGERKDALATASRALMFGGAAVMLALAGGIMVLLRRQIGAIEAIYQRALVERQASEERERHARAQAEAANRAKDEFLATVSHELRTPLSAILGWARLLRSGRMDVAKNPRALEAIERSSIAQAHLIDDLLDVSRIVTGKLRLERDEIDLHAVVGAAIEAARPAMEAKRIRFRAELDPAATRALGDPVRLQQVVWNLLSNAVKFTASEGHVELRLRRLGSQVELTVRDDGEGIEPQFLPRVFHRFEQQDSSTSRAHGGLGLGLAISRHLVELHGGTIEASSEGSGLGATFTVKLPLLPVGALPEAPAPEAAPPALERAAALECPAELQGLKVLVVDDEPDARELVTATISGCGCVVHGAATAREALALVRELHPDVILSDVGMPGEDGYELLRQLRRLPPEEGGRTPAAALTAYARAADRRQALRAGFEMHLPKPVEPAELLAALATLARIGGAMSADRARPG